MFLYLVVVRLVVAIVSAFGSEYVCMAWSEEDVKRLYVGRFSLCYRDIDDGPLAGKLELYDDRTLSHLATIRVMKDDVL
jgi:hypothetical protein